MRDSELTSECLYRHRPYRIRACAHVCWVSRRSEAEMVRSSSAAARMEEMLRRDLNTTKASLIQRTEQLCVLYLWTV